MASSFEQFIQQMNSRLTAIESGQHPAIRQILEQVNGVAAQSRQLRKLYEQTEKHNQVITGLLQNLQVRGGSSISESDSDRMQYIDDIPGRRMPFDLLAEIPIDSEIVTAQQQTIPISNAGPFIARGRYISFLSQYRYSVEDPESGVVANFSGRSFGRFRAPHSAADMLDGHLPPVQQFGGAAPGSGNALWASPVVHSPFRSMQPDARIRVTCESDGFPRENMGVPSAFWTTNLNSPFPLPAMDFFDRNESINISVTPLHVNNPTAGNLTALPGVAPYPFLGQQYDHHEGVVDPYTVGVDTDPVTRLPSGIFILGFTGFRIFQAPGALGGISQ
jgi:hypothetical protein